MAAEINRNERLSRYELIIDGDVLGIADYHASGDAIVLPHTVIEPARRGKGLGATLVRGVLDDMRERGETVVPACWYVASFIGDNPEYRDLLAA
jgi:predicted GNAT family acetyltransferase